MSKSPQQIIFDECMIQCSKVLDNTFPYLPDLKTGYPFIYVSEQFADDIATKSLIHGTIEQRIHFYHNINKRGDLDKIVNEVRSLLYKINYSNGFYFNINRINLQTMTDQSTSQPLWHFVLSVQFRFN